MHTEHRIEFHLGVADIPHISLPYFINRISQYSSSKLCRHHHLHNCSSFCGIIGMYHLLRALRWLYRSVGGEQQSVKW